MFLFTVPAVLYIDRVGRKPVLTIGAIGMATCHIIIAIIFAKDAGRWHEEAAAGWAAVVMVCMETERKSKGKQYILVLNSNDGLLPLSPSAI